MGLYIYNCNSFVIKNDCSNHIYYISRIISVLMWMPQTDRPHYILKNYSILHIVCASAPSQCSLYHNNAMIAAMNVPTGLFLIHICCLLSIEHQPILSCLRQGLMLHVKLLLKTWHIHWQNSVFRVFFTGHGTGIGCFQQIGKCTRSLNQG